MKTNWTVRLALIVATLGLGTVWADGDPISRQSFVASPNGGSCQTPVGTMSNVNIGSQGASLTLSNNTGAQSSDYLIFHYTQSGVPHLAWLSIVLPAHTYSNLTATFTQSIDQPVVGFRGNQPDGGTDQPDPIVGITQTPPQQ